MTMKRETKKDLHVVRLPHGHMQSWIHRTVHFSKLEALRFMVDLQVIDEVDGPSQQKYFSEF